MAVVVHSSIMIEIRPESLRTVQAIDLLKYLVAQNKLRIFRIWRD
ncbi:hypothetical protein HMPREF0591_2245 [Mycobacterium parascrofulaceum ATCC BAA-614]|uniref:Uncharacterized protein n=1 Tax=Mycobacterium parascrofulaceum ATCC BAA-614 TaxID=525368 RepID=D5P7V1_9MYCO|nr:hypothetical protein HMPREF0591_2245 [Mycobacterium parascrofulaceum ATCC BAA-614]